MTRTWRERFIAGQTAAQEAAHAQFIAISDRNARDAQLRAGHNSAALYDSMIAAMKQKAGVLGGLGALNTVMFKAAEDAQNAAHARFLAISDRNAAEALRRDAENQDRFVAQQTGLGEQVADTLRQGLTGLGAVVAGAMELITAAAAAEAADLIPSIRSEVQSRMGQIRDVMRDLRYAITHPWTGIREAVAIQAALSSKDMRDGLNSSDPEIRRESRDRKRFLVARLKELTTETSLQAFLSSKELRRGLKSRDPEVRKEWRERRDFAKAKLQQMKDDAKAAADYISGLRPTFKLSVLNAGANDLLSKAAAYRKKYPSPMEHGGPVQRGMPYIVGERRPEVFVPDQNGTILPNTSGMGSGRLDVYVHDPDGGLSRAGIGTQALAIATADQVERRWRR